MIVVTPKKSKPHICPIRRDVPLPTRIVKLRHYGAEEAAKDKLKTRRQRIRRRAKGTSRLRRLEQLKENYHQNVNPHKRKRSYRLERKILLMIDPHCVWCECKLDETTATLEHVRPLSCGGANHFSNYALACRRCNNSRGSGDSPDEASPCSAPTAKTA